MNNKQEENMGSKIRPFIETSS